VFLKLLGMGIVLGTCVVSGLYYGNVQNYRYHDLTEMKRALGILAAEIAFARSPLPEALRAIALRVRRPLSDFFEAVRGALAADEAPPGELWAACLARRGGELYFNREDVDQLAAFGELLGRLDKQAQMENIQRITGYIDGQLEYLNTRRLDTRKLYGGLGVLGGLLAVVVFF
jgi:stage III sporulation protein AB